MRDEKKSEGEVKLCQLNVLGRDQRSLQRMRFKFKPQEPVNIHVGRVGAIMPSVKQLYAFYNVPTTQMRKVSLSYFDRRLYFTRHFTRHLALSSCRWSVHRFSTMANNNCDADARAQAPIHKKKEAVTGNDITKIK